MIEALIKLPVWLLLGLSAISVIAGDFFAKYWSINRKTIFFVLALVTYACSGLFYTPTLVRHGLIITSLIWAIMSVVGFLIIGAIIFDETLTKIQMAGVALGIISVIILALEI